MFRLFSRHVLDDLAAFDAGLLDRDRARRVQRHLDCCPACVAALQDVRRARVLLEALPGVTMPAAEAERLRERLRQPLAPRAHAIPIPMAIAAALVIALGAVLLGRSLLTVRPVIDTAPHPRGLERLASDLHEELRSSDARLEFTSANPAQVRRWLMDQSAPPAQLVSQHPPGEGFPAITMRGASVIEIDGARASLISYRVDGYDVSLITAREADIRDVPARSWLTKHVYLSRNPDNHPLLTWSTSGQTYAIVSDLPDAGERACFACHATPRFKRALDREIQRVSR